MRVKGQGQRAHPFDFALSEISIHGPGQRAGLLAQRTREKWGPGLLWIPDNRFLKDNADPGRLFSPTVSR
jgi:hypothetical protein